MSFTSASLPFLRNKRLICEAAVVETIQIRNGSPNAPRRRPAMRLVYTTAVLSSTPPASATFQLRHSTHEDESCTQLALLSHHHVPRLPTHPSNPIPYTVSTSQLIDSSNHEAGSRSGRCQSGSCLFLPVVESCLSLPRPPSQLYPENVSALFFCCCRFFCRFLYSSSRCLCARESLH